MRVPVLTAVSGALWEAELVAAFESGDLGVTVVRRCVDLADLLATASTGTARAALLSADLRRLDREALTRLGAAGLAVVGLVPPPTRRPSAGCVSSASGPCSRRRGTGAIAAAVLEAVEAGAPESPGSAVADPRAALPDLAERDPDVVADPPAPTGERGRVVAVWGPTGAPGRTTVAVGVGAKLAALGCATLLVDADVYGGVVAQVLGLLDESRGSRQRAGLANNGALDLPGLARLSRSVRRRCAC